LREEWFSYEVVCAGCLHWTSVSWRSCETVDLRSIYRGWVPTFFCFGIMGGQVETAHKAGLMVNVWIVDKPKDMCWVYEQGTGVIITNKPHIALQLR
jgi:hypothetical protein